MASETKGRGRSIQRLKRLVRGGRAATRPAATPGGLAVIPHEPQWTSFSIGRGYDAVELSGRLEGGEPGLEKSVVGRVRLFDQNGNALDHRLTGLRMSEAAGKYFYPLEYVRDGVFRFSFAPPPSTARVDVALQHWRKGDRTLYGQGPLALNPVAAVVNAPSRIIAAPPDEAREKLREAEQALRDALRHYANRLVAVPGPLYGDEAPFGEPLAEYLIHDEGAADAASRLAGRRLRAGRDREAIGLIGLSPEPELDKAYGRRRLYEHMARQPARPRGAPAIRRRSLVYLLHNSLPHDSGGYAARSHGLLRGYVQAGWEVHAFTRPGYPGDRGGEAADETQVVDGVAYHRLADETGVDGPDQVNYVQRYAEKVLIRLRGREIGFVQAASFFQNGFAGRMVADRLGVPLVYEMRGMEWLTRSSNDPRWLDSDQCRLMRDLELRAAADADHVFAITGALKDWLVEAGLDGERISLLPNGCSSDLFRPLPRDEALAARLGLKDAFVAAYIGSFAAYEGVPEIITATGRARDIFGGDIRLLLVGDGQMAPVIDEHIRESGAQDYVIRTGRVPHEQAPAYYSLADALVLARGDIPLTRMISPLKPLEALAAGAHVISTDVAAVREILDEAGAGRIVPPGAPYGLAHAIAEAARNREALRSKGAAAHDWAAANRDWSVLAKRALAEVEGRFAESKAAAKSAAAKKSAKKLA